MTPAAILPELEHYPILLDTRAALVHEVEAGLTSSPKSLAPWMFYDAWGSCLFERITTLPEYYPFRIEREILGRFAERIIAQVRSDQSQTLRVFELGAGIAAKTGILLEAAMRSHGRVSYLPYDVSPEALNQACTSIESLLPSVRLQPIVGNYVTHPPQLARAKGTTLALYIGTSIGNFSPQAARTILCNLRSQMHSGDALLLGTDMVKDEEILLAAYDDREGVTAEFNLNILRRLNRELCADFDSAGFRHRVRWNRADSRIEMHIESLREQYVRVPAARLLFHFTQGETIHTENSYKFTQNTLSALLDDAGFRIEQTWNDPLEWYALTLAGTQ
ncbi:MAG TPA: L-histidine N(alpha)-methyltransferase [Terriglobia bacterium]|nr:L-histidine N(alpha)-methyltransferase [Terriglobia bacterium]